MIDLIRLTRPLNLLIMALTMAAMRYGVVGAWLDHTSAAIQSTSIDPTGTTIAEIPGNRLMHAFTGVHFWLLVLSTLLIAAGGNVINDYFDTRIDRVNKPAQVIVGRTVKRRVAMAGHLVLSGLGLAIGAFVAWRSGQFRLVVIPAFAVIALWSYSTRLKRAFLIGNGTGAGLAALVPITVGLYEVTALARTYPRDNWLSTVNGELLKVVIDFNEPWYWILGYGLFAFLATLVREIQKDLADVEGDRAEGCRTLPIVLGMRWGKAVALTYMGLLLVCVLYARMALLHDRLSYWYIGIAVITPLLLSAGFTYNASTRREHGIASHLLKAAMVIAILYAFLLRHTIWDPARLL